MNKREIQLAMKRVVLAMCLTALSGLALVLLQNGTHYTAPNTNPDAQPALEVVDPGMPLRPFTVKGSDFTINPVTCTVTYNGVTATKQQGICTVEIDATLYPYVNLSGGSCTGFDATVPADAGKSVVKLTDTYEFHVVRHVSETTDDASVTELTGEAPGVASDECNQLDLPVDPN